MGTEKRYSDSWLDCWQQEAVAVRAYLRSCFVQRFADNALVLLSSFGRSLRAVRLNVQRYFGKLAGFLYFWNLTLYSTQHSGNMYDS
jgi:hypothetical protein